MRHLVIALFLCFVTAGCVEERRIVYVDTYPGPVYVYGYNAYPYEGGYYFVGGYYSGVYYRPGYYHGYAPFWHSYRMPAPYYHGHPGSGRPPPPVHRGPPARGPHR